MTCVVLEKRKNLGGKRNSNFEIEKSPQPCGHRL